MFKDRYQWDSYFVELFDACVDEYDTGNKDFPAWFSDEDQDFLDDLARYKDLDHFDPAINTLIARAIGEGQHRITPANLETYIAEATRRARAYPLGELAARLSGCVEPQPGEAP